MRSADSNKLAADQLVKSLRAVWAMMLATLVALSALTLFSLSQKEPGFESALSSEMTTLLVVMAGFSLVGALLFPSYIYKSARKAKSVSGSQPRGSLQPDPQEYFAPYIIRLVFAETIALYGFVMTFLSMEVHYFLIALVPAALIILRSYPTESFLKRAIAKDL